ncbi:NBAS subunit of NRZ tethering complex-like isoform X2 [Periplaneta americana]|uniref:NBAS subunit of NRZ tethering complex-like isoform X2 n=1 Tax=Periplaneta americana TaxID=6978 RepID=UPI0037E99F53
MRERHYSGSSQDAYDDCILYELLVYSEWKQEPELTKSFRPGETQLFSGGSYSPTKYIWQIFRKGESVCEEIQRLLLRQLPWHFAVGEGGKVVAILQDTVLEIRTSRDEYSSVVGKASVAKDPSPQLRKLAWSPDCSMLAVAHSSGAVSFYDLLGSNIFNISQDKNKEDNRASDKKNPLVFIGFLQSRRKGPKWSAEVMLVDYHGTLSCYSVSPTDGYQLSHTFSFSQHYRQGVLAVNYHAAHNMLFVCGPTALLKTDALQGRGSSVGLSAWRLLNDHPFYRLALSSDEEEAIWHAQNSWWNWVPSVRSKPKQSVIFKMQVSPMGKFLACLHSCGSISLWHLPAIRLYKYWSLQDQPDYDARNPQHTKRSPHSRSGDFSIFRPVDINWWTDQAVIVARHSGAISVCSVGSLRNLLGESPEFLAGPPQVSALCSDHGFLGLECETVLTSKTWSWDDSSELSSDDIEDEDEEDDDDDDDGDWSEDSSLFNRSSALLRSAVYLVTDMERFQPKRRKPRLCRRTYRLLGLKSTTPEELYARKIDNEEYGEALALAKAYNLDCDLVYQQQWRNSKVSIATIHDYLSKVTKRSWVLKECVERVPETFSAARELLQFGLDGTCIETFLAVGKDGSDEILEDQFQDLDDRDEEDSATLRIQERNKALLSKMTVSQLTDEQIELLKYRRWLLQYYDRLCTYELILGGPHAADDLYDCAFYDKFRTVSLIESAVKFARKCNWQAVETMFTYHGAALLPHWLPIVSNFPESMNPFEYHSLLPECSTTGTVYPWSQMQLRERDWSEEEHLQLETDDTFREKAEFVYANDETLKQFGNITAEVLTSWYRCRVHQIESRSCLVDHALTLVKLGRERNIAGLDDLYGQLLTLDTLVYDVHLEDARLCDLQKMSNLDTCKLLMSKTTEATFVEDLKHLLLPFALRCERQSAGCRQQLLSDFLLDLSTQGLTLPLRLFEHLRDELQCPLVPTIEELISLALVCLYAYPNADQLGVAFRILECLPGRGFGSQNATVTALHDKIDALECDLHAAEVLDRNSIAKSLSYIRDCKTSVNMEQQLMVKLARMVAKRLPPPTETDWNQLLSDMLDLQAQCFKSINIEECFEIYVATILASGRKKNIEMVAELLVRQKGDWDKGRVSYYQSVQLVLQAAMEYFDSAGSAEDPAMDLARTCLNLITDENEEIREQLDLITAVQMLYDFGTNLLPLQVRLCSERLRLVELCIQKKTMTYRSTQRLLQLAHKLHVCGSDARQREGHVLVLIAEAALKAQDYQFCAEVCQQLVQKSHALGWQVVQALGQSSEFDNLQLRCDLLAFALLYCPDDVVEVLVNTRSMLQAQLLHDQINRQVKQEMVTASEEEEFCDALTSPVSPAKEFPGPLHLVEELTETTKTITLGLVQNIGNKNFWKNTFSWMQRNRPITTSSERDTSGNLQGFPAFYLSLVGECHVSSLNTQYDRFSPPNVTDPVLQLCQGLLRTILLEGTAAEGHFTSCTNVLVQLAEQLLLEDSCLGLCHILPLEDTVLTDTCFDRLPCSITTLQLAMYHYALKGYTELHEDRKVYLQAPRKLVEYVVKHAEQQEWAQSLLKYKSQLLDLELGQQLQSLGCGVDLHRFTHDSQYRQDSILGLAMTVDADKFLLAVGLGSRHGVAIGEIVARHLSSLLLSSEGVQLSELSTRLASPQLSELFRTSPQLVNDRLVQSVYPSIVGTDHQLLLSYYTVLQAVAEDYVTHGLTPKEHIKLLRKVKATSSDIDYKKMVDPNSNLLEVLLPALQRNNIGLIVKLLKSMPSSIKCSIQPGELYAAWAQKEFFKVKIPDILNPVLDEVWLEQYELCTAHFNKMEATDVLSFIKGTCFDERGVAMMSIECRMTILTRTKEYCQLKLIYPLEDEADEWSEAAKQLDIWLAHLKVVSSSGALQFCRSSKKDGERLLKMLDLSMGEMSGVAELLREAVLSELSLESLQHLMRLLPEPAPTLEDLLKEAVQLVRNGEEPKGSHLLSAVLRRLQENLKYAASSAVPQEVETLCGDPNLTPEIRLQALELLQNLRPHEVHSDTVLLYRHTQASVATAWSQVPISIQETDLQTPESRAQLFSRLLAHAHTWQQILILKDLLDKWPNFKDSSDSSTNPWMQLIYKIITFDDRKMDEVESVLDDVFQHNNFSPGDLQYLVSLGEGNVDLSLLLLVCLLPDHSALHATAVSLVQKHLRADDPKLTDRLRTLLLQRGLAPALVATPAYPQIIEHLLLGCACDLPSWSTVAGQLIANGNVAEAGSVLMLQRGVSPALAVFSSSLALAKSTSPEE